VGWRDYLEELSCEARAASRVSGPFASGVVTTKACFVLVTLTVAPIRASIPGLDVLTGPAVGRWAQS
jgi:hypothetical protein